MTPEPGSGTRGKLRRYKVYVDGEHVGDLRPGESWQRAVPGVESDPVAVFVRRHDFLTPRRA